MKHKTLSFLLALLMSMVANVASASEQKIGDLNYYLYPNNMTATVMPGVNMSYSGDITIPATVEYKGETYSVVKIADKAFMSRENLTSISIPNSVTKIGSYAFQNCTGLTSVTIPNSVTQIYSYAFSFCTGLTSITLSHSLESIETGLFKGCTSLTSISIPKSATCVSSSAFYGCNALKDVRFEDIKNLKFIADKAFSGCSALTDVTCDNMSGFSMTRIMNEAFLGCEKMKNCLVLTSERDEEKGVCIPSTIETLGAQCFSGCKGIKTVRCASANSLKVIMGNAFANCDYLENFVFDDLNENTMVALESIGQNAFLKCHNLKNFYIPTSEMNRNIGAVIPANVKEMRMGCFNECNSLLTLTVQSEKLQNIPDNAFASCTSLSRIDFADGLLTIGQGAFYSCFKKDGVYAILEFPKSLVTIGMGAFQDCYNLTGIHAGKVTEVENMKVYEPSNLEMIEGGGFENCKNLKDAPLQNTKIEPGSLKKNVFKNTKVPSVQIAKYTASSPALKIKRAEAETSEGIGVILPSTCTRIEEGTFADCAELKKVDLPSVTYIGNNAFSNTAWLKDLPDGLNYLGTIAFKYAGNVSQGTTIDIKEGTTCIAGGCFSNCRNLVDINIPNTVTEIGESAFEHCGFEGISLPDDITEIKENTFSNCTNLKEIEIPNKVTTIGDYAFQGCSSLETVIIPSSVTNISSKYAFSRCTALKDIYNWSEVPQVFEYSTSSDYSATLHVPVGCKEAYEQATVWKNFTSIVEEDPGQFQLLRRYDALLADAKSVLESIKNGSQEGTPLINDVSQLSSPYTDPYEGSLAGLLDGSTSTFWHSNWRNGSVAGGTHYLQADLINPADMEVYATFTRRPVTNDHVTNMSVLGTNNISAEKSACEELLTFACPYGSNTETITSPVFQTKGYRYLRFYANSTTTERGYWHISEFQIYNNKKTDALIDQMEEEAARLQAVIDEQTKMERSDITEEEYNALKETYDAFMAKLETVTGVGQLTMDNERLTMKPVVYDLSGRQMVNGKLKKGIYIVNGKKVLVR